MVRFGRDPGHESLTAYGLMQFHEMQQVFIEHIYIYIFIYIYIKIYIDNVRTGRHEYDG